MLKVYLNVNFEAVQFGNEVSFIRILRRFDSALRYLWVVLLVTLFASYAKRREFDSRTHYLVIEPDRPIRRR